MPHIDPLNVYTLGQARTVLGLRRDSLSGEIKAGRLRVSVRVKRYFFLGKWLLEWIEAGELSRTPKVADGTEVA